MDSDYVPRTVRSFYEQFVAIGFADDEILSAADMTCEDLTNDFADGNYENPLTWHKKLRLRWDRFTNDMMFTVMEEKHILLSEYGSDPPEYAKWKLFVYNTIICYDYINKGKSGKALEIISDIEKLLISIGSSDPFLKSIRIALNHVTFSMKGHLLKLCSLETVLEKFLMPIYMDNTNRAGLFGIQSLFVYYGYGLCCLNIAKNSVLTAISLNKTEAEWHFLNARLLLHCSKIARNFENSELILQASKKAVEIGKKDHHKLNLVNVYFLLSRTPKMDFDVRQSYMESGLILLNEVMDTTNDLFLLMYSLSSLSKVNSFQNSHTLEKLIDKMKSINNDTTHGSIGKYYLYCAKEYDNALLHLKKAFDAKCCSYSIDYIYALSKMNTKAPVEEMLKGMLKTFPHPVYQETILSHIVAYLLVTKDDLFRALKYIPLLLDLKNEPCVASLRKHRMYFYPKKLINVTDVLSKKLNAVLNNQTLSEDRIEKVKDVLQILKSYKIYSTSVMKKNKKHNIKMKYGDNSNEPHNENIKVLLLRNNKKDKTCVKNNDEENWRTLKPDSNPGFNIYSHNCLVKKK